ncbi:DTW domain-containing protein 1 [Trachymyrmex septentrionalis]|uniref:tRNA-uridine aminocarboxypropyltransferase 1 n=1 Tax=Trachymyrmex septentrionalis TaxID=34720 RepID=A0A195FS60_9HYME|nr:DTW domain-containing protein 1 [Trachymyrmex septentrionalis]
MAESTVKYSTDNSSELEEKQRIIDGNPFCYLKINDTRELNLVESRRKCDLCQKSRKFFCYTCYHPVLSCKYYPRVKLPIKIDIIKHPREIPGKSTAIHAAIIAPADVKIYTYPDFPEIPNKEETVLVFPGKDSTKNISVKDLFIRKEGKDASGERTETYLLWPIKKAIFIDSTWHQTKSIYKDQRLRELMQKYNGQYDNLLYFFKYMFEHIHSIYNRNQLKAYKRPLT